MQPLQRISLLIISLVALAFTVQSATIRNVTITGHLPDLDGDGSNLGEQLVLEQAVHNWVSRFTGMPAFSLLVNATDIGSPGLGGILDFDSAGIPAGAGVTMDTVLSGFTWFVDHTPWEHSEFGPSGMGPQLLAGLEGPQLDLLSSVQHEIGHALGWHINPSKPSFNPLFLALTELDSYGNRTINLGSTIIQLADPYTINGASHAAMHERMLMSSPRLVNDGRVIRTLISANDLAPIAAAYGFGDVPEPSAVLLIVPALGLLYLLKRHTLL